MKRYIVTVRLPKRQDHDPRNKVTGTCPLSAWFGERLCSDVTGQHHSFLATGPTLERVRMELEEVWHVTRIEEVL